MPTQQENTPSELVQILDIWISGPGVAVTIALCALITVILLALVPAFRNAVFSGRWSAKSPKGGEIEYIPPEGETLSKPTIESSESVTPSLNESLEERKSNAENDLDGASLSREDELFSEMITAAHTNRDRDALDKAYQEFIDLKERKFDDETLENLYARLKLAMGEADAIQYLEELEEKNTSWVLPSLRLSEFFESVESYDRALDHIDIGLKRAQTNSKRVRFLRARANVLSKTDRADEAIAELNEAASEINESQLQARIFDKLADLYEETGNSEITHLCLEKCLQLEPENNIRRFRLAHSYGETQGNGALAIYHYRILARYDRRYSSTLNNLGVQFDKFDLKGEKIRLWNEAKEFDQPYPSGNLAIAAAEAGFINEATRYIEELPDESRSRSRAVDALTFIATSQQREQQRLEKLNEYAANMHQFRLRAIVARETGTWSSSDSSELLGTWQMDGSEEIKISSIDGNNIKGDITTNDRIYEVTGTRIDVIVRLNVKQTKLKFGLGGLLGGDTTSWIDAGAWRDEYNVWLVLEGPNNMAGYKESDEFAVAEISLVKVG